MDAANDEQYNIAGILDVIPSLRKKYLATQSVSTPKHVVASPGAGNSVDFTEFFPFEVLMLIMSFLGPRDVCMLGLVNHALHACAEDDLLWRQQAHNKWGSTVTKGRKESWKQVYRDSIIYEGKWIHNDLTGGNVLSLSFSAISNGSRTTALKFNNEYLVGATSAGEARVWNLANKGLIQTVFVNPPVSCLDVVDQCLFLGSSNDVSLWNIQSGILLGSLPKCDHKPFVALTADEAKAAVFGGTNISLVRWDIRTGQRVAVIGGQGEHGVSTFQVDADADWLVSGTPQGMVYGWDLRKCDKPARVLAAHKGEEVVGVQFNSLKLMTHSLTALSMWDPKTFTPLVGGYSLQVPNRALRAAQFMNVLLAYTPERSSIAVSNMATPSRPTIKTFCTAWSVQHMQFDFCRVAHDFMYGTLPAVRIWEWRLKPNE